MKKRNKKKPYHIKFVSKYIPVNEYKDWLGFALWEENKLWCRLYIAPYDNRYLVIFVCGGKHFYKKIELKNTLNEAIELYNELLEEYNSIPDYVCENWFIEHGFEYW